MKTIVLFDQYADMGGGQTVLLGLIEAATQVAERVVVVAPTGGSLERAIRGRFGDAVRLEPIAPARLTSGRKRLKDIPVLLAYSLSMLRFRRLVGSADLVHVNGARMVLGAMLLSTLTWRPFLYHLHIDHSKIEKRLFALAARLPWTAAVLANSEFTLQSFRAAIPSSASNPRLALLENGLDRRYASRVFVDRFADASRRWTVLVAGAICPDKGQDLAVEAARRVPAVDMHVVGRINPGAEAWAAELSRTAPANVVFHDPTPDMPALIDALAIRVSLTPSRWEEAFGLVSIEAMACSCIAMVSARGALPSIAAVTGAIVCDDVDAMVAALDRLMAMSPADLAGLARRQFEAATSIYAPDRFVAQARRIMAAAMRR